MGTIDQESYQKIEASIETAEQSLEAVKESLIAIIKEYGATDLSRRTGITRQFLQNISDQKSQKYSRETYLKTLKQVMEGIKE
jgi:hypothetical protein